MQDMSCFAESKTVIKYNISKVSICNREVLIMPYYTYILECADGSLYTGYTDNLEKRLAAHNAGGGAKYTRGLNIQGDGGPAGWYIRSFLKKKARL